jgi:glycosyltransferase involved in cell wall biosynthesis
MRRETLNGAGVAVVVTTYNRPTALAWVLASLAKQTVMPAQIVIADDGSGTETLTQIQIWASYFKQHFPETTLIHVWQEDLGFRAAAARNLAVERARAFPETKVLIFLDGDCVAPPFFIENHLALLASKTMVAGGRGLLSQSYTKGLEGLANSQTPEALVSQLGRFNCPYKLWLTKACDRYMAMQPLVYRGFNPLRDFRPKDDGMVRTCNLSVWLEDFIRVDGFDQSFVGWGLEDTDFAVRLIYTGVKVRSGRFATNVFHLWHSERSRSGLQLNAERLNLTRETAALKMKS